jgi:hypothetical protein
MNETENEVIFQNNMGVVDLLPDSDQHIQVAVPNDRSFLSLVGNNRFAHGDQFCKDGWVYQNGKPYRKWFGNLYFERGGQPIGRIWEPKLKDVAAIEALRWKAIQYVKEWQEKCFMPAYRAVVAVCKKKETILHARVTDGSDIIWCKYRFFRDRDSPYKTEDWPCSYSHDWLREKVRNPKHVEIAQRFYEVDQHCMTMWKRRDVFLAAFEMAMFQWMKDNRKNLPEPHIEKTLQVEINGRFYWYQSYLTRSGWFWQKLHWPEEELLKTSIT